jgi:hypothetical protein
MESEVRMNPWLWLPIAAAGLVLVWKFGPGWLTEPDENEQDEPTEEVPDDAVSVGLGIADASALGGYLGSEMPDLRPPDAGDEVGEE